MIALLLACGTASLPNPLLVIDRDVDRTPYVGEVIEVRDGGGYAYQRVDDRWTVSLGKPLPVGTVAEVKAVGRSVDFTSRRTGHHYDELWFVTVSKARP